MQIFLQRITSFVFISEVEIPFMSQITYYTPDNIKKEAAPLPAELRLSLKAAGGALGSLQVPGSYSKD